MAVLLAWMLGMAAVAVEPVPEPEGGQEEEQGVKLRAELHAFVAVAGSPDTFAFTLGGPRLSLDLGADVKLIASFFPSVVYDRSWGEPRPSLGFGPEIMYKRFAILAPVYYVDGYRPTVGIGYRL